MMNAVEHPALSAGHFYVPGLNLVLPDHLDASYALQGLVASIEEARAGLAGRVERFRQLEAGYAPVATRCARLCAGARLWALRMLPRLSMRRSSRSLTCGSSTRPRSPARGVAVVGPARAPGFLAEG